MHSTREAWLTAFIDAARPTFAAAGIPLGPAIRVSIGFPSSGKRSKTLGECFYSTVSSDGAREIFIRPSLQDDVPRICDVLTHELIHAALPDGVGHKAPFKRAMSVLGLEGRATATIAGDGWRDWALPIIETLGAFPGAAFSDGALSGGKKKQTTRYLKVTCTRCDFVARVTAVHAEKITRCPCGDCAGQIGVEL